jgi:hypothetical protein
VDFDEALERHGFGARDERNLAPGSRVYAAAPNRFMTYTVHAYDDGTALFSWEFAIADYLSTRGIQVGSDEALNQFMYPRDDVRGPQDGAWLAAAVERTEAMLAELRFDRPDER